MSHGEFHWSFQISSLNLLRRPQSVRSHWLHLRLHRWNTQSIQEWPTVFLALPIALGSRRFRKVPACSGFLRRSRHDRRGRESRAPSDWLPLAPRKSAYRDLGTPKEIRSRRCSETTRETSGLIPDDQWWMCAPKKSIPERATMTSGIRHEAAS